MNWDSFFAKTLEASGSSSYTDLAGKLGITQAAVSHYRTGKRTPPAWTVAACLRLQGHAEPEREAARIMLTQSHSASERAFWRRLGTAAGLAAVALLLREHHALTAWVLALPEPLFAVGIMRSI